MAGMDKKRQWYDEAGIAYPDIDATHKMEFPPGTGNRPAYTPPASGPPRAAPVAGSGTAPFVRIVFPPRTNKLPGSKDFLTENYELVLPAGVGSTVVLPGFQLTSDLVGWIQEFRLYILSQLATTRIEWQLRINQGAVPGFSARLNPPGVANLVLIISNELQVRIPQGALVDVLITNLDGAAATVGAHASGWIHTRAEEIRIFGDGPV